MATRRTWWIALALGAGYGLVLAAPMWLLWQWAGPELFGASPLEIRFESVKMDRGALVFAYHVTNRTRRLTQVGSEGTEINVLQPGNKPPLGFAVMRLPLDLGPHASQQVEVRLELPGPSGIIQERKQQGEEWLQEYLEDTLHDLRGFELVNQDKGVHVVFPRGW